MKTLHKQEMRLTVTSLRISRHGNHAGLGTQQNGRGRRHCSSLADQRGNLLEDRTKEGHRNLISISHPTLFRSKCSEPLTTQKQTSYSLFGYSQFGSHCHPATDCGPPNGGAASAGSGCGMEPPFQRRCESLKHFCKMVNDLKC